MLNKEDLLNIENYLYAEGLDRKIKFIHLEEFDTAHNRMIVSVPVALSSHDEITQIVTKDVQYNYGALRIHTIKKNGFNLLEVHDLVTYKELKEKRKGVKEWKRDSNESTCQAPKSYSRRNAKASLMSIAGESN